MRAHGSLSFLVTINLLAATACTDAANDDMVAAREPDAVAEQATDSPSTPADPASVDPAPTAPVTPGQPSVGVTFDWVPGDYPPNPSSANFLTISGLAGQGNRQRGYKVHVPKGYDPKVPAPVLYAFHGFMQSAPLFVVNGTGFIPKSDQEGFILVMPNGIQDDGFGGSWNAGVCCGVAAAQKLDDVGFVRAIHAEIQKHLNVDAQRVYATGLSNGGFMTHRLGCEASDLFAAIAPVAGSIGTAELGSTGTNRDPDFKQCTPTKRIAVLMVHGDADGIVPYAGMKPSLDHWARANACQTTTEPAPQPASGGDTTCVTYPGCDGVEVTGCSVKGGGHCWFGDASCGTGAPGLGNLIVGNNSNYLKTSDAVWSFVSRFRRAP
jgi:polyhydroxybutyrate depolymerase